MKITKYFIKTWIKFKIAHFLDKHTDYCWADLVMWAAGWKKWREVGKMRGSGYCGKCQERGLIKYD